MEPGERNRDKRGAAHISKHGKKEDPPRQHNGLFAQIPILAHQYLEQAIFFSTSQFHLSINIFTLKPVYKN